MLLCKSDWHTHLVSLMCVSRSGFDYVPNTPFTHIAKDETSNVYLTDVMNWHWSAIMIYCGTIGTLQHICLHNEKWK